MIRIPKEFVLRLIRDYSAEYQGKRFSASKRSGLMDYLIPKKNPRELGRPALRVLTTIGYMDMGKSVTVTMLSLMLSRRLREKYRVEPLMVAGKSIVDVVKFIQDNPDLLQDRSSIVLFIDDMLYQGMSTERRAKSLAEKYYSDIRHKPERLGFKKGLLVLFFAGQRFKNVPPFFRNTPRILFKGIVAQDSYERSLILDVLKKGKGYAADIEAQVYLGILESATELALDDWVEEAKRLNIIVHFRKGPKIYVQPPGVPDMRKYFIVVPFNYSGEYGEDTEDEGEAAAVTIRERRKQQLMLLAAGIRIGMKLGEYGIGYLSVPLLKNIARKAIGLSFGDQLVTTDLIEEAWKRVNKRKLERILNGLTPRAVVIE